WRYPYCSYLSSISCKLLMSRAGLEPATPCLKVSLPAQARQRFQRVRMRKTPHNHAEAWKIRTLDAPGRGQKRDPEFWRLTSLSRRRKILESDTRTVVISETHVSAAPGRS